MRDFLLGVALICPLLSSFTVFGIQGRRFPYPRRILDNLALIGKGLAILGATTVLAITANPLFLIPVALYVLSTYFWSVKVGRKGALLVWTRFYEMEFWDQKSIDESRPGVMSAVTVSVANIVIIVCAYMTYMGTL